MLRKLLYGFFAGAILRYPLINFIAWLTNPSGSYDGGFIGFLIILLVLPILLVLAAVIALILHKITLKELLFLIIGGVVGFLMMALLLKI